MENNTINLFGRLAFCELNKADEKGRKKTKLLIPLAAAAPAGCLDGNDLWAHITQVAQAKFGQGVQLTDKNTGFKNGDACLHTRSGQPYDGHAGHYRVSIGTQYDFAVMAHDPNGNKVYMPEAQIPQHIYSGAWVVASVEVKAYDRVTDNNMRAWGVTCYLQALLWVRHDEKLGGGNFDPEASFGQIHGLQYDGYNPAVTPGGAPGAPGMPGAAQPPATPGMPAAPAGPPPMPGMPAAPPAAPAGPPAGMAPPPVNPMATPQPAGPPPMPGAMPVNGGSAPPAGTYNPLA